jgi:two-component system response regulator DevR
LTQDATSNRVRLLLVDDHEVVRIGLRTLFQNVCDFAIVGEAATAADAICEARRVQPDIVILDVRLPDGSGVDVCREIVSEHPHIRVIMLTSYDDETVVVGAIMANAAGYLTKQTEPARLVEAVRRVARGESLLDPAVTTTVLGWMRHSAEAPAPDPLSSLSLQERNILPLIAEGKTNREIAAAVYLSENTVRVYISYIFQKLGFTHRAEAAAFFAALPERSAV